jgi:hypothetical protein
MATKRNHDEYKKLDKVLTKIQHVVLMALLGLALGAKGSTRLELDLAASIAVGRGSQRTWQSPFVYTTVRGRSFHLSHNQNSTTFFEQWKISSTPFNSSLDLL